MSGFKTVAGLKLEKTTYGIPDQVGTGDKIHIISEGISQRGGTNNRKTFSVPDGTIELSAFFDPLTFLFLFGKSHLENSPQVSGSYYVHYIEPDISISSRNASAFDHSSPSGKTVKRRATLLIDNGEKIIEVVGLMGSNLTLTSNFQSSRFTANVNAAKINTEPQVNTSSSQLSFLNEYSERISLENCTVKIKPRDVFYFSSDVTLDIQDTGLQTTVTIPAGTYKGAELAKKIEVLLNNNTTLTGNYIVDWIPEDRKFLFSSDVDFKIFSTGSISESIGFSADTGFARYHYSDSVAKTKGYDQFTTQDEITVTEISVSLDLNVKRDGSPEKGFLPAEGVSTNIDLNLSFQLYKYGAEQQFINIGELADEVFEIHILFSGQNEQFEIVVPQAKLKSANSQVTGASLITQEISFRAENLDKFYDFRNLFFPEYSIKKLPPVSTTANVNCIQFYDGNFYAGDSEGKIYRLDYDTWTNIGNTGTTGAVIGALYSYKGLLYIGAQGGNLYTWDGSTLTLVGTSTRGQLIIDFEEYNDLLFMIDEQGNVLYWDGSTIYESLGVGGNGWQLMVYKDKLYAGVQVGTTNIVAYSYDGTSWTLAVDFGVNTGSVHFAKLRGYLFALGNVYLKRFDGSTWVNMADFSSQPGSIFSVKDELFGMVQNVGVEYYDVDSQVRTSYSYPAVNSTGLPYTFENRMVFIPASTGNVYFMEIPHKFIMKVKNKLSSNPFL